MIFIISLFIIKYWKTANVLLRAIHNKSFRKLLFCSEEILAFFVASSIRASLQKQDELKMQSGINIISWKKVK